MLTMSLESGLVMAQKEGAVKTASHLESLTPISRKALLELRNAMHNVEPLAAGEQTLGQAVRQLIRDYQSATDCSLKLVEDPAFEAPGDDQASSLFRMIQEALTNACHHADARTVQVTLQGRSVSVSDDGKGFDLSKVRRGRGLDNLKSRAEEAGMVFVIGPDAESGVGTRAEVRW
jgi:two-component system NarL family sensor kinase